MNTNEFTDMRKYLIELLNNDELLNKKGRDSIYKLIKSDESRAALRHAIKSAQLDQAAFVEAFLLVCAGYNSNQGFSVRTLCDDVAANAGNVSSKWLERHIIPFLCDLGIVIKAGERSYYWQQWDKIGAKPTLTDKLKTLLELTPAQREAKEIANNAYAEKCKLDAELKRERYALQRRDALLRAQAAITQANELAAQTPAPATLTEKAKSNPAAVALMLLLGIGVVSSLMTAGNQTVDLSDDRQIASANVRYPSDDRQIASDEASNTRQIGKDVTDASY